MHRVTSSLAWILGTLETEESALCPREAEPSPHCVTVAGFNLFSQLKLGGQANIYQVQLLEYLAYFHQFLSLCQKMFSQNLDANIVF